MCGMDECVSYIFQHHSCQRGLAFAWTANHADHAIGCSLDVLLHLMKPVR
jgi:hypothetical protein